MQLYPVHLAKNFRLKPDAAPVYGGCFCRECLQLRLKVACNDRLKRKDEGAALVSGPELRCWIIHDRPAHTGETDKTHLAGRAGKTPGKQAEPAKPNQTFCLRFNASFPPCQHLPEVELMSDVLLRSGVLFPVSLYAAPPEASLCFCPLLCTRIGHHRNVFSSVMAAAFLQFDFSLQGFSLLRAPNA